MSIGGLALIIPEIMTIKSLITRLSLTSDEGKGGGVGEAGGQVRGKKMISLAAAAAAARGRRHAYLGFLAGRFRGR